MNDNGYLQQATPFTPDGPTMPADLAVLTKQLADMTKRLEAVELASNTNTDAIRAAGRMPGIGAVTLSGATYTATEESTINALNVWARDVDARLRAAGLTV